MQLDILLAADTLEGMVQMLTNQYGQPMRVIQESLSMFESYQVRPTKVWVSGIWMYRVVCNQGKYYFGKLKEA